MLAGAFGIGDVARLTRARARVAAWTMTLCSLGGILFVAWHGRPDAAVLVVLAMPSAMLTGGVHVACRSW